MDRRGGRGGHGRGGRGGRDRSEGARGEFRGNQSRPQSSTRRDRSASGVTSRFQNLSLRGASNYQENQHRQRRDLSIPGRPEGRRGTERSDEKRANDRGRNKRFIGYQKLKSWTLEEDRGQLVLMMGNESEALEDLLSNVNLNLDWYDLLIEICQSIITVSHQKQVLKKVLTIFVNSHFFGQCLYNIVRKKNERSWPDAKNFYDVVLAIVRDILDLLPQCASQCQMPLLLLPAMVSETDEIPADAKESLIHEISDLQEKVKKKEKENIEVRRFSQRAVPFKDSDTPPEDFRELSVIPNASDLSKEAEPFVRAILSKGAYRDVDHYLDVQFRLMREDFVQPLRNGINDLRKMGFRKDFKSTDIRLYFDVHIIGMTTVNGINHVLRFENKSLKSINWEHSKRFLTGSLICLSKDNFETVFFATVVFREPKDLKDGIITVEFKTGSEAIFCSTSSDTFIMVETTAYFEAYYPILEGLQELNSSFSLQKYFIFNQCTLKPPEYLLGGVRRYDLSSLTKSGEPTVVPALTTMSWPRAEKLKLNESQMKAVQLALTKELAIIQGPPGTGKTYVGLNVMKVLLQNEQSRVVNKENHDPILVLCYTNHALDQFLEGVYDFCPEGVVRVGGRSSSEIMENLNLRVLKKKREISRSEKTALWNSKNDLQTISQKIEQMYSKMNSLSIKVEKEMTLEGYMIPEHYQSLMSHQSHDGFTSRGEWQMKNWLNATKTLSNETLPESVRKNLTKLILQMPKKSTLKTKSISPKQVMKLIKELPVIERACVYQGWLRDLFAKLDLTSYDGHTFRMESKRRILCDMEIHSAIPDAIYNCIYSLSHRTDQNVIENWVLGLDNNLNNQLNDSENLIQFYSQNEQNKDVDNFDELHEVGASPDDRLNENDKTDQEEITKSMAKIKEGEAFLLLRAEQLGIGNDTDYDNERGQAGYQNDDVGWTTVTNRKSLSFSKLRYYLTELMPMTEEEEEQIKNDNLWNLNIKERFALYNLWIQRYRSKLAMQMEDLVVEYKSALAERKEIRTQGDVEILKRAKVIGMTTTGAAKYRAILQEVACRIVVVEEAAEVLEAHIITALNKNCKHLILIGDHQQLKPNPTVYSLAKDYHLDLSLFERLINNGLPHITLKEQHRMRESISKIMRHIYPNLEDHISVTKYEHIRGIDKNIFFISHEKHESSVGETRSKSNEHEASYLVALLQHLLLQGYDPSQITILATYVGQILILKNEMKSKNIEGVRLTSVDNFQGEENDIILLSLVRSNDNSSVGFLKVDNRVCVALSRAKKGLYAIGNFKLLASQSKLWSKIVATANSDEIYGEGLPVVCPNHTSFRLEIASPKDFQKKFPEGGCGRPCEFRLPCGHTCSLKCHGYDSKHEKVDCSKTCTKSCSEGHPCRKQCKQDCGMCSIMVNKTIPRCGHTDKVACYLPAVKQICKQPCDEIFDCQHQCAGKCGECHKNMTHMSCKIAVEYFWPCDHICKVPCYMSPSKYPCPMKCKAMLQCGHTCYGTCSDCVNGTMHIACKMRCTKVLPCGHACTSLCGVPCPPCSKVCSNSCKHSKCSTDGHACGDECTPCQEPCLNRCTHQKCTNKCFEECDIDPCEKRCLKLVNQCQHPCSGLCGELCVCALCHPVCLIQPKQTDSSGQSDLHKENAAKSTNKEPKGRVNISEKGEQNEPPLLIKIPNCGHIFHVSKLDFYVKLFDEYSYLPCPQCRKPIEYCNRYNKIIKKTISNKELEKLKIRLIIKIPESQKTLLIKSQLILTRSDIMGKWHDLRDIDVFKINSMHHATSLNHKFKYAYVLSDLLLMEDMPESSESEVLRRVKAVNKLETYVTLQQKSEFKMGIMQLLLRLYIKKFEENSHGNCLKEEQKLFQEAKKAFEENKKAEKHHLVKLLHIVKALEKSFETGAYFTPSLRLTQKKMNQAIHILDSRRDQMLCDTFERFV